MGSKPAQAGPSRERSPHRRELDGLRALAVLAVVVYHATRPAAFVAGPAAFAIGARGVDLFFVLSGFCLSWPYASGTMRSFGDALTFFRRRVTRIVPPFYVALALFALLALTPFGLPSFPNPTTPHGIAMDLLRDAAFVPTMFPAHDSVLWTLGIEMRWYLAFPLLLIAFYRSKLLFFAIAEIAYAIGFLHGAPLDFGVLPAFMLGVLAADLVKRDVDVRLAPPAALLSIAIAAVVQLRDGTYVDHASVAWHVAFFALVLAVTGTPALRRIFSWKPLVAIGVASYSIYLVHDPIIDALSWAGVPGWLGALAGIAFGFAFWSLVEAPLGSREARGAMDRALLSVARAFKRARTSRGAAGDTAPAPLEA